MTTRSAHVQIRVTPQQKAALKRLAAASGQDVSAYILSRTLPADRLRFEEILRLLARSDEHAFALAELNDFLTALAPMEFGEAVAGAELDALSPFLQNYVAALVEQTAELRDVPPPSWTAKVPPLERPYFAAPLASLRLHLLRASPAAFKRRNLFVDSAIGTRV